MSEPQTKKAAPGLRHVGSQGRNALVILGYNRQKNEVMILDMNLLRDDEIFWLAEFISQEHVYQRSALAPSLAETTYSPGVSAFLNFASRAQALPYYEVRLSDKDQTKEWVGSDSGFDHRIPPHPLVEKIRERRAGVKSAPVIPVVTDTPARSSGGDVNEAVRQFLASQGDAASSYIAKADPDEDKSWGSDDSRLTALEGRLANIEKLLTAKASKPAAKSTTKPLKSLRKR